MRLVAAIGLTLALAGALAPALPAAAQGKPSAASRKRAREHYEKAKAFQEAGRYAEAVVEYEAAHEAVPDPAFLYNVARCLHLSGERERAIEMYDAYLAVRSRGEIAEEAKSFAAELRAELAADKEAADRRLAAEKVRAARLAPDRVVGGGAPDDPVAVELTDRPTPPRRSTARRVAWIAGGAVLIGGGVLVDTIPDSGHNGSLEATDFIPVGLYLAGLAAISLGIF